MGEFSFFAGADVSFETYADAYIVHDAHVTNHSYVESLYEYGAAAQLIDEIIRGDGLIGGEQIPARPQVWAAGNNGMPGTDNYGERSGYYSVFTQAKNSISVGSIDAETGRLSDFSSIGPTFDGRIKPDVMAPGCIQSPRIALINSTQSGVQGYDGACGTSVAAPFVTGLVALMVQHTIESGAEPVWPSTYKAILVETATDIVSNNTTTNFINSDTGLPNVFHRGPDFATGFGLVDGKSALALLQSGTRWAQGTIIPFANEPNDRELKPEARFCVTVNEGDALSATLAWDDAPSDAITNALLPKLVNDLDLVLVAPDGSTHLPWVLLPPPIAFDLFGPAPDPISLEDILPAVTGRDDLNNVEKAEVTNTVAGRWTVIVRGHTLPLGEPQKFSLAASHPLETQCPN
ncbi:MAG: S8 family serine peptidase [Pseudomonadota bacterium]